MTDDGRERTSVATVRFVAATIATIVVQACTLPLVKAIGGEDAKFGWAVTIGLYAITAAILSPFISTPSTEVFRRSVMFGSSTTTEYITSSHSV